jgi:hypothetical protein
VTDRHANQVDEVPMRDKRYILYRETMVDCIVHHDTCRGEKEKGGFVVINNLDIAIEK